MVSVAYSVPLMCGLQCAANLVCTIDSILYILAKLLIMSGIFDLWFFTVWGISGQRFLRCVVYMASVVYSVHPSGSVVYSVSYVWPMLFTLSLTSGQCSILWASYLASVAYSVPHNWLVLFTMYRTSGQWFTLSLISGQCCLQCAAQLVSAVYMPHIWPV